MSLSSRASNPQPPLSPFRRRLLQHYATASTDPLSIVNLSIAENTISSPLLHHLLRDSQPVPADKLVYNSFHGDETTRHAIAGFLSARLGEVHKDQVTLVNGAGSAVDLLGTMICEHGDLCLIPSPGYSGFKRLLRGRAGVECFVVPTEDADGYPRLTIEKLDDALQKATKRVGFVIIPSPDNPTGQLYSRQFITEVIQWARSKSLHIVFDEVYALSVHSDAQFVSALSVLPEVGYGDDVHVIWSFSKDFGMSGLRMGVLVTRNQTMLDNLKGNLSYFSAVSRQSQWLVEQIVTSPDVQEFLDDNTSLLRDAYQTVTSYLDRIGVRYVTADAGLFVWIDLRDWCKSSLDGEMGLWDLLCKEGVLLMPGNDCLADIYGFFRLCFASVSREHLEIGLSRIDMALKRLAGNI